jgi:hypothetical protein
MRAWVSWALLIPAGLLFAQRAPSAGGVVFVQIPAQASSENWFEGARLVLLQKDGSTRVLTGGFDSAADPAVSFDGKRILFAGKRSRSEKWDIFEMNPDDSGIRQITRAMGNCRSPMHQSALFYLDDARPSYQVTFVSDVAGEVNEDGTGPAAGLYSIRFDGSGLRRLTYALSGSYDPFQLADGRILFSNWHSGLFGISLDGTDYSAYSGPQGRRVKRMACATGEKVVFIESGRESREGAGSLATLSIRRNLHSYKALTKPEDGWFHSPSPLPDGSVLVSRRPRQGTATYSIVRLDLETGRQFPIFADPKYQNVQAVALAPRPEPDGHSSVVEDDQNWSKLYCLSVYENDLKREWLPAGTAKRIRVIEGVPPSASAGASKRLLGDVALDEDGSFHLTVPPNTPFQLQMLDSNGMALRTSAWLWTKNKESRGCIGCHEDGERTPENEFPKALGRTSAQLTLPPERRRVVDFRRDVAPIVQAKCSNAACHTSGLAAYVDPGRARTSRLVWAIFGQSTARPWDSGGPTKPVTRMPPAGSPPLTKEETTAMIEWIDLGAYSDVVPANNTSRGAR